MSNINMIVNTTIQNKLNKIKHFMSKQQHSIVSSNTNDYEEVINRLYSVITSMSVAYEQDGLGDDALVYLHYFFAGSDWYVLEKDSCENEQNQAFGFVILNNDIQSAELGYISINELISLEVGYSGVELDFYFDPRPLGLVKQSLMSKFGEVA